jgi:Zn-dependent peptidase ImmA (M78 family)
MSQMVKKLIELYTDLVEVCIMANVGFWDTDLHGPGVVIDVKGLKAKYVIVLGKNRTWEKRVFVLCHEMGHIFYPYKKTNKLKLRKSAAREKNANIVACKILDTVDVNLKKEYVKFYNTINKGSKRKKFELPK